MSTISGKSFPNPNESSSWQDWAKKLYFWLNNSYGRPVDILEVPIYSVTRLPKAIIPGWIFVPDETGGAVMAFSDGADWRRCTDRAVVS